MYERAPEIHQTSGLDAFKITHCRFSRQVSAEFGRGDLILLIELIYQFLDWFDFYNCTLNDWDLLCCHSIHTSGIGCGTRASTIRLGSTRLATLELKEENLLTTVGMERD